MYTFVRFAWSSPLGGATRGSFASQYIVEHWAHNAVPLSVVLPPHRPVVDPNGFDHDDGMNAFTVEKNTVLRKKGTYVGGAPAYIMAQVHKDKDQFSIVVGPCHPRPHLLSCCLLFHSAAGAAKAPLAGLRTRQQKLVCTQWPAWLLLFCGASSPSNPHWHSHFAGYKHRFSSIRSSCQ